MSTKTQTKQTASASQNRATCEHETTRYVDQCDKCGGYVRPASATVRQKAPEVLTDAKRALEGDSNDAEHDALFALVEEHEQLNARLIVANRLHNEAEVHAEKLAEALREIRNTIAANGGKNVSLDWIESKAGDALAQWEGVK